MDRTFGEVTFEELENYFPEYTHEEIKIAYLFMHFNPIRSRKIVNGVTDDHKTNLLVALDEALYANAVGKLYTVLH
jgi:hypothetical protein